ncbi:MAG: T9SS type A sorting domain-containing protein, partial [Prevotellaceae bacterium]|nr:T9SS type A sorting domain-containing protein [Prevotellaceae bacterium]
DVNFGGYGDYIYGSGCAYAPAVVTDKKTLEFSPDAGVKTFTVSAVNLVSPLVIVAPQGLSVHPDTVYPLGNGSVPATPVEVRWEEGSSAGGVVRITGGGLAFAKEISVNATGFSDYCNKVLNYWGEYGYFPAYLSVGHTEGSVLSFTLAPVYGEAATWNNNSIQAGKVTVSRAGVTLTDRALNENEITLTFSEPLQAGDVVSIGPNPAFVWTTQSESGVSYGNCYIDPLQTYTVGASCELVVPHPAEKVAVQSVEYASTSFEGGQATVVATNGTYPVASIRFWEENGKLPYREVGAAADGVYEISGLEPYNTYSINVAAVDEKGYASDPVTLTIKNLGTLVADDFPFEHTVTYDGLPHAAEFTSPDKAGEVTEVLYNSSPELPVAVGSYTVTIDVLEGDGYHAASDLSIGTLSIVRGGVGRHLLEYAIAAHTYSGEPYPVEVSIKPDVEGAGEVTAVKYNGSADVPANAGAYAVTVDVSEGENFDATVDLLLDTLHILRAATTVDKLTWTAEDAVYSGEPNVAVVQPAEGVVGLGEITLRYNDGTEAVDAGRYTVFADVAQGGNYEAATGVAIDSFTIGKATLAAEHFTFPPTMPYDGTPRHLPVTLVEPYTGEGIITVKYDGSETPPVESGSYAVSVSVAEGSNFVATTGDVELGSFAVQTEYSVTVQVSDVDGHRMISPPFTVTLAVGDVSRSLTTVSGQAAFEGVPRHSAFTVSAAAAGYTVSASVVGSLQSDTTIVLTATEESSLTAVAEEKSVLLSAYVAGSVLHISPDVESVRMVNVAGVVALDVPGGRGRAHFASTVSLAHLPSGIYFVLLRGGGEAKTLKVVLLNYEL